MKSRLRSRLASITGAKEGDEPGFDLSSLIDVSFLLLIYFLVTSTLQPAESDLGMTLGGRPITDLAYDPDPFRVEIDAAGAVLASRSVTDASSAGSELPGLQDSLRVYVAAMKIMASEPIVEIYVADEARNQRFIDVLNCVAGERVEKVTFGDFAYSE